MSRRTVYDCDSCVKEFTQEAVSQFFNYNCKTALKELTEWCRQTPPEE